MVLLKDLFDVAMNGNRVKPTPETTRSHPRRNKWGFHRVTKIKNKTNTGFIWKYTVQKNHVRTVISGVNLMVLKEKVECRGFPWVVTDEVLAKSTVESEGLCWELMA